MTAAFSIDAWTGAIRIGEGIALDPGAARAAVEPKVSHWRKAARDHGNGYAWLYLDGQSFGGAPAALALCFHHGRLAEASWSVQLPGAGEGWPSREAIAAEIAFVRDALAREIGFPTSRSEQRYGWGTVWSDFDPKAFIASHGLRYGPG